MKKDIVTRKRIGVILTKEKGGKVGEVNIPKEIYDELELYILSNGKFKINYQKYVSEIRNVCEELEIKTNASHGFRWNFAQRRVIEYQRFGYTYEEALSYVSYEMKHNRMDITLHYAPS